MPSGFSHLTGSLNKLNEFVEDSQTGQTGFAFSHIIKKEFFYKGMEHHPFVYLQVLFNRFIVVQDPEVTKEIFTTKMSALDKSMMQKDISKDLFGDAFVFD